MCGRVAHSSRDADGGVHGTTWIWWSGWACDQLHSLARLTRWASAWWYLIERVSHCAGRIHSCIPSEWDSTSCKGLRSITEYSRVKLQTKKQHAWARQLNPLCFSFGKHQCSDYTVPDNWSQRVLEVFISLLSYRFLGSAFGLRSENCVRVRTWVRNRGGISWNPCFSYLGKHWWVYRGLD